MAVDLLQTTAQTAARGRPFKKGQSGNPAGRPLGRRNEQTLAAEALLQGEAAALTRKAIELALQGDPTALKLCLERILARPRERPVRIALPALESAGDPVAVISAITAAAASSQITPGEAFALAQLVETAIRAISAGEKAARLAERARRAALPAPPRKGGPWG
jgi:hypothetical protein